MKRMVWEPVQSYAKQEIIDFKSEDKLSRVINTRITGRMITLEEYDRKMATLLPRDMAVCRLTETDVPSVPVEAMRRVLEFAEIGVGHDQYDPELQAVRAWLDGLEQAKGGE